MTATLFLFPGTLGVLVAYHLQKPHGPSCSKAGFAQVMENLGGHGI